MGKKIVFLDIDGTLTRPGQNVPPDSALSAIRTAQQNGHIICLCSGRNYNMLLPLAQYRFDGLIASAGGYIECQGQVLYDCPMTPSQQEKVLETLAGSGLFYTLECKDGSFTSDGFKEFLRSTTGGGSEMLRWQEQLEKNLNVSPMSQYRGEPVYKVSFSCVSESQIQEPLRLFGEEFQFCLQEPNPIGILHGELINRRFNKGTGVRRLCSHLNIPLEDSIGFGDSMNDLEMIETVGLGVCMENGCQALKQRADDICPAVTDDGLAKAFRKYGLI